MNLLDQARKFVSIGESAFNGLAIAVVEIEEQELWKEAGYESFVDFYTQDLGREKSTISRLRTAGKVLIEAGYSVDRLPSGQLAYKRIAQAKTMFPDKNPKELVAIAQTWNPADYKEHTKEVCKNPEYIQVCKNCWATPEKHA